MKPASIWRAQPQRYRGEAARCVSCGAVAFPPRLVCAECGRREFESYQLPHAGRILSYTILHVAASQFADETPLAVGIIELDDGVRITCQIADAAPEEIATGMRVHLEFRKIQADGESGVIAYGHKAVPE